MSVTGGGVRGSVEGHQVDVGTDALFDSLGVLVADDLSEQKRLLETQAKTVMLVAIDGKAAGLIAVADKVKADSVRAIAALKELGMNPVMISGDNATTARAIADEVNIDQIPANVLPEDKSNEAKRLQDTGQTVAMVGDGINDAGVL